MASDVLEIGHQQVWYWLCVYEQRKKWYVELTHWGRVICISKLTIIGSGKCLSPGWCQAIIWTSAGRLLIGPLGTNFSESLIEIHTFPCKKMHLKISFAKWCLFCPCPNVLTMMLRCNNVLCTWQVAMWWVSGSRVKTQGSVLLTGPWITWFQMACLSTGPWLTWFQQAWHRWAQTGRGKYTSSTSPGHLPHWPCNGP